MVIPKGFKLVEAVKKHGNNRVGWMLDRNWYVVYDERIQLDGIHYHYDYIEGTRYYPYIEIVEINDFNYQQKYAPHFTVTHYNPNEHRKKVEEKNIRKS